MEDLNTIISAFHEGVELYSLDSGRLLGLNERIYKIFGISEKNILESEVSIFCNPNFPEKLKSACRQKKHIRIMFPYSFEKVWESHYYESRYRHKELYLQCYGSPVVDDGAEKYILIMEDFTSQVKKRRDILAVTKEQSGRAEKLKTVFVDNVAHDFRTPLNAIVGFSQLIGDADSKEEHEEYARIIMKNAKLLTEMVYGLLELSAIKMGYLKHNKCRMDFSLFFNEVVAYVKTKIKGSDVQLIADNPYKSYWVSLDRDYVLRLTKCYVGSVLEYMKEGDIKMGYRSRNKGLYTYIEGTGMGIPEEKWKAVISYFENTDDFVRNIGAGLVFCEAIVMAAGGKLGMSRNKTNGLIFWMWLPCKLIR